MTTENISPLPRIAFRFVAPAIILFVFLQLPAVSLAQQSRAGLFGRKESNEAERQTEVSVQTNPAKESFVGKWGTSTPREVLILESDGTGTETASGKTLARTWRLLAGGKMRIDETSTDYYLAADGNALFGVSDGRKWTRANVQSASRPSASTGENLISGTHWRFANWTYEFKSDGTWVELNNGTPHLSGTWAPEGDRRARMTSGAQSGAQGRFEISDDGQTLYRMEGSRWGRIDAQGDDTVANPAWENWNLAQHAFAGTRWRQVDGAGRSVYFFSPDGTFTGSNAGKSVRGRWLPLSGIAVEQTIPFGIHYRFTLSDDGKTMERSGGTTVRETWRLIEGSEPEPESSPPAPRGNFDSFYFDDSKWINRYYHYELNKGGRCVRTFKGARATTQQILTWRQIDDNTVFINDAQGVTLKLSDDKKSAFRQRSSGGNPLTFTRDGPLPIRETANFKAYNDLMKQYHDACLKMLETRIEADQRRLDSLQRIAEKNVNTDLAVKIRKLSSAFAKGEFVSESVVQKGASPEEDELLKIVRTRNAAVSQVKTTMLQRGRGEFDKMLRQALGANEHDLAKKIEQFMLFELIDDKFFTGKWKREKTEDTVEFRTNGSCRSVDAGGEKRSYSSISGRKYSYTEARLEVDDGTWFFDCVTKELCQTNRNGNCFVFRVKDKQTIERESLSVPGSPVVFRK